MDKWDLEVRQTKQAERLRVCRRGQELIIDTINTAFGTPFKRHYVQIKQNLEKNGLTQMEFDTVLTYAINDFKQNYAQHINAWETQ